MIDLDLSGMLVTFTTGATQTQTFRARDLTSWILLINTYTYAFIEFGQRQGETQRQRDREPETEKETKTGRERQRQINNNWTSALL